MFYFKKELRNQNTFPAETEYCRELDISYMITNKELSSKFDDVLGNLDLGYTKNTHQDKMERDRDIVSLLYSNLLRSIYIEDNCFSYSRGKGSYPKQYNPFGISKDRLIELTDILEEAGYIQIQVGFNDSKHPFSNRQARILPAEKYFEEYASQAKMIASAELFQDRESIILKNSSKKPIPYDNDDNTNSMRNELKAYNNLLRRTDITVGENDVEITTPIEFSAKFVRRIFIEEWDQLGRFYGPWWQFCPSELRQHILINGNKTIELDVCSQNIGILFAASGVDIYQSYKDPYTILNPDMDELERKFYKDLLLLAVNTRSERATLYTLEENYKTKSARKKRKGQTYKYLPPEQWGDLKQKLRELKKAHPLIAEHFFSKNGLLIQHVDSEICATVIRKLTAMNIPVLTIHDSFIVEEEHEKLLEQTIFDVHKSVIKEWCGLDVVNPKLTRSPPVKEEQPKRTFSMYDLLPGVWIRG